jgi:hypothetical protein
MSLEQFVIKCNSSETLDIVSVDSISFIPRRR